MVGEDGDLVPGDLDDAWQYYFLRKTDLPEALAQRVRAVLEEWDSNPTGRLVELLPVMDDLALLHGASLPELALPEA